MFNSIFWSNFVSQKEGDIKLFNTLTMDLHLSPRRASGLQ